MFANALNYLSENRLGFMLSALLSGILLTAIVAFGFRMLGMIAIVAVPLFFLVTGFIIADMLHDVSLKNILSLQHHVTTISLSAGIAMVIGGYITAVLTMPDVARYCRNKKQVTWMIIISVVIGELIINGTAALIAQVSGTEDVVTIMTQGAGWIGLASVLLSTIKINNMNLYSSSLALVCIVENISGKKQSYALLTMILGGIGTLLSVMGILEKFTDFLIFLGVIFSPVTGVLLCDYYLFPKKPPILHEKITLSGAQEPCWPALFSSAVGIGFSFFITSGITAFNSLIIASVCYYLVKKYLSNRGR